MGLLRRDPEQRLSGNAALRLLPQDTTARELEIAPAPVRETPFVGRAGQLEALHEAFRAASNGNAAAVSICGPSGIGKSALVRCFLSQLARTADVVVLSGRCYENESVPYKALDGVVDHLSRYLASLPRADAESPVAAGPVGLDARLPCAPAGAGHRRSPRAASRASRTRSP